MREGGAVIVFSRRKQDAEKREALIERRRQEDAAPRLRDAVPTLQSLRMRFEESRPSSGAVLEYTRHVMVAMAPALFEVRCSEPRCTGSHDLTSIVLAALRARKPQCEGTSACQGNVGDLQCDRTLSYVCQAEFQA
jgi:hypothetical protein